MYIISRNVEVRKCKIGFFFTNTPADFYVGGGGMPTITCYPLDATHRYIFAVAVRFRQYLLHVVAPKKDVQSVGLYLGFFGGLADDSAGLLRNAKYTDLFQRKGNAG